MRNLTRIKRALYCEPWLVTPEMHRQLCGIVAAHESGAAHLPAGISNVEHAQEHGVVASEDWDTMRGQPNGVTWYDSVVSIDVGGVIGRRFSAFLNSSGVTSVDVLERMIRAAAMDDRVDGIVLDIDSPGGTVAGTPEAAQAVEFASERKPVAVYTGGMMASAAYWIGAPADAIFAAPSASIGSIGVYSAFMDQSRAMEMAGLKTELFKAGTFKAMGVPGVPLTDEQRELLQSRIDEIYDWFTSVVMINRRDVANSTMQGQTFMASEAMERNLIDGIGTFERAIEYVRN